MQDAPNSLFELLNEIKKPTGGDRVSFQDIIGQLDSRSFGPLLLLPAIVAVGPTGAIPGMSLVTGTIILLVAVQILAGRRRTWLPDRVNKFSIQRSKLTSTVDAALPWARWIDGFLKPRWTVLVEGIGLYAVAIICAVLAIAMFPLALVPFGVAVPGIAIGFFALGLTTRDGLIIAIGYVFAVIAVGFGVWYFYGN